MKQGIGHTARSPKTFIAVFLIFIFYALLAGDQLTLMVFFPLFIVYWIYIDYSRGVPKKWKREYMVNTYKKKQEVLDNGGTTSSEVG